jgi:hypothetical protein
MPICIVCVLQHHERDRHVCHAGRDRGQAGGEARLHLPQRVRPPDTLLGSFTGPDCFAFSCGGELLQLVSSALGACCFGIAAPSVQHADALCLHPAGSSCRTQSRYGLRWPGVLYKFASHCRCCAAQHHRAEGHRSHLKTDSQCTVRCRLWRTTQRQGHDIWRSGHQLGPSAATCKYLQY